MFLFKQKDGIGISKEAKHSSKIGSSSKHDPNEKLGMLGTGEGLTCVLEVTLLAGERVEIGSLETCEWGSGCSKEPKERLDCGIL